MDADRNPGPALLDYKKVIEPLRITVADDWSGFTVRNGHYFPDTSGFSFQYRVEADGGTSDGGRVDVAPVSPQKEAVVHLPRLASLRAGLPHGHAAVLTVSAVPAAETAWAPAGHEVAWGQSVHQAGRPAAQSTVEAVSVQDTGLQLGPVVFSRITGMPASIGGVPVEKLALALWWPPTDNDLGRDWGGVDERPLATQWKDARLNLLNARLLGISAKANADGGEALTVRTRVSAADKHYGVLVDYTWTSDGEGVALRTRVRPDRAWVNRGFEVEWARIGVELSWLTKLRP